jgi:hypothetical protein
LLPGRRAAAGGVEAPRREISWLVRYVNDKGIFTARTSQTKEAAELFIGRILDAEDQAFRSWAEVWTRELRPSAADE